ncbi:MAG: hypothetical protein AB8F94_24405 [Saprospiraceae bacterium]
MKKTTYFPSKIWNYSIFASTFFRGIFALFVASDWVGIPIAMIIQFFVGFTLLLPLYFLWVFLSHLIFKKLDEERNQKTGLTYLTILFAIGIYQLVHLTVDVHHNYFFIFDGISFGVSMFILIWVLDIKYEYPPISEDDQSDILDDNFDFSEKDFPSKTQ